MTEDDSAASGYWKPFKQGVIAGILVLIAGAVYRIIRPFWHAYRIDSWLRGEPSYISEYSRDINPFGYFKFDVQLSGTGGPTLIIENVLWKSPVRIEARKEFDPSLMAYFMNDEGEEDDNQVRERRRRQFQFAIESVLANSPGVFGYRDIEDQKVSFKDADNLVLEYRLYPDGMSQHELMNGIVNIANAMLYVDRREKGLREEIADEL